MQLKIHCIVASSISGKQKVWIEDECQQFSDWSRQIDQFIMHNGISFDAPILNRLTGSNIKLSQVRDTLIESQLYNPIRDGGHSLQSWGEKTWIQQGGTIMIFLRSIKKCWEYCQRDTELTRKVAGVLSGERVARSQIDRITSKGRFEQ